MFSAFCLFLMICLIWNCQGAASREVLHTLKDMIKVHRPAILGILEPKISGVKADDVCNKLGFDDWVRVEALGFSGGIWVLWKNSIKVNIIKTHPQFIMMQVKEDNQDPWCLAVVYGSPSHSLRKRLWRDLRKERLDFNYPWLAVGDFNAVVSASEVSDPNSFARRRNADFVDWIFDQGLIDIGYEGPSLTWRRGVNSETFKGARLDRALGDGDRRLRFNEASVKHLPMIQSDHSPILINTQERQGHRKPMALNFRQLGSRIAGLMT